MIQKKKICNNCDLEKYIWKREGKNRYCQQCWNEIKPQVIKDRKIPKKIKKVSSKREKQVKVYKVLRDHYLKTHPFCEVKGCKNVTTNLHHKAGRRGEMLFNAEFFMACCSECHPKKIHENPNWARENGYII